MDALKFPRLEDILESHEDILRGTGGEPGVLNAGSLSSALDRCRHGPFLGSGDEFERAALLLRGIAQDHPFVDGNKRTAYAAADTFLRLNGLEVGADSHDVVAFMLQVAKIELDLAAIEDWLRGRARKV